MHGVNLIFVLYAYFTLYVYTWGPENTTHSIRM